MTVRAIAGITSVLFAASLASACTEGKKPDGAPSSSAAASASAPASAAPTVARGSDEIRPVYPVDAGPPDPLAQRYCDAVHEVPARRMSECCGQGFGGSAMLGGQCVRVLTAALSTRAVALDAAGIDKCAEAMKQVTSGCDWVMPYATLALPAACDGIIKGTLAEKARCRSSLECGEGMRCQGLSTVDLGTCGPPKAAGGSCNLANDMLATFTRQDDFGRAHPECEGQCAGRRCLAAVPEGGACKFDEQCGRLRCAEGKCAKSPPPRAGEPCSTSRCGYGLRCAEGKCVAPKAEGDACTSDLECRGACDRGDGGAQGKCQKTCELHMPALNGPPGKPAPRKK